MVPTIYILHIHGRCNNWHIVIIQYLTQKHLLLCVMQKFCQGIRQFCFSVLFPNTQDASCFCSAYLPHDSWLSCASLTVLIDPVIEHICTDWQKACPSFICFCVFFVLGWEVNFFELVVKESERMMSRVWWYQKDGGHKQGMPVMPHRKQIKTFM